jgi:hypothetical protein
VQREGPVPEAWRTRFRSEHKTFSERAAPYRKSFNFNDLPYIFDLLNLVLILLIRAGSSLETRVAHLVSGEPAHLRVIYPKDHGY